MHCCIIMLCLVIERVGRLGNWFGEAKKTAWDFIDLKANAIHLKEVVHGAGRFYCVLGGKLLCLLHSHITISCYHYVVFCVFLVGVLQDLMVAMEKYITAGVIRVIAYSGQKVRVYQTALMWSREKIREQHAHRDRYRNAIKHVAYSAIVCLGDVTKLTLWPGTHKWCPLSMEISGVEFHATAANKDMEVVDPITVYLNTGDILLFRVDLVHCGCAYEDGKFIRVHSYVDVGGRTSTKGAYVVVRKDENEYLRGAKGLDDEGA